MKTYEVIYMPEDAICWEKAEKLQLNHQWVDVPHIQAWAQVCWNENGLHLRMQAKEKDILCRYTGQLDQVCTDSCLEFFFSPTADGRYLNLEANPKGTLYLGLRYDRNRYVRFVRDDLQNVLQIKPFTTEDGWGIEATFCVDFLQLFYPDICLTSGMEMKANFYKCGNDTPVRHYLTWNTVETPQPDYHQPAYFGKLILK